MSLKRYAIIAAVSYHNSRQQQQQQQQQQSTTTVASTKQQLLKAISTELTEDSTATTTITPFKTATMKSMSIGATTTATATTTNWFALNTMNSSNNSNNNNATITTNSAGVSNSNGGGGSSGGSGNSNTNAATNSITTYYGGGLGLFHQQNLRANGVGGGFLNLNGNSGSGSGSGVSYPNTINGNVNLLLGGAMLSLVTTILCVVCYCCHRNIKKRTEAAYRQQRQWLENDPNMEIYSVEQCYETSGLFLGESTDGLSTIPALHHEPPPSYDAVVAMQEQLLLQQQQQQLQQQQQQQHSRTSPPPGYRSTLDVSAIQTAFAVAVASATGSRGTLDGSTTNDSNGNLNLGCSNGNGNTTGRNNIYQQKPQQLLGLNPLLNMKKVLQAQSCCSLQRAEVENMWNAAAAAVAARNVMSHPQTSRTMEQQQQQQLQQQQSNGNCTATAAATTTPLPAMLMMSRKSLPTYTFGRHYRHQKSYYRRGCPLCGKFRYDAEDALSLSTESGLDDNTTVITMSTAAATTATATAAMQNNDGRYHKIETEEIELDGARSLDFTNNNNNNNHHHHNDNEVIVETNNNLATTSIQNVIDDDEDDECSCDNSISKNRNLLKAAITKNVDQQQNDYLNGNELTSEIKQFVVEINESPSMVDDNANFNLSFNNNDDVDGHHQPSSTSTANAASPIDLNSINDNGIVRLDMSKIIDKTGLPTYEAALKLESSGYV